MVAVAITSITTVIQTRKQITSFYSVSNRFQFVQLRTKLFVKISPQILFSLNNLLCAAKECEGNIRLFMEELINPETTKLENGIPIENACVKVEIIRSMFSGKMAAILSGAGGASCQMCTATHDNLKDRDLVVDGFTLYLHSGLRPSVWRKVTSDN